VVDGGGARCSTMKAGCKLALTAALEPRGSWGARTRNFLTRIETSYLWTMGVSRGNMTTVVLADAQ
jgi:hypothetical protein